MKGTKIFSEDSINSSLENLLTSLYQLRDLRRGFSCGDGGCKKNECSPGVKTILELSHLIKDWDTNVSELCVSPEFTVQLWADKKSFRRAVVALQRVNKKGFTPAFFIASDTAGLQTAVKEVLDRIGVPDTEKKDAA